MEIFPDKSRVHAGLDEMYTRKLFFGIDSYEYEERAAIMEFDGGMTPQLAAQSAFNEIIKIHAYLHSKVN
jgi:hypothetical protein